jgi:acyl-CoA dehydrogenase
VAAPLMDGEIRSAFLMTEPAVASSDATNIECRIERDGDEYVINGRKWWSSGAGDPALQGRDPDGQDRPRSATQHQQQSMILVPLDAPGVTVERRCRCSAMTTRRTATWRSSSKDVRVPPSNMLLGEGRGFEIAQGRLGPGRIHHCMRTIGAPRKRWSDGEAAAVAHRLRQEACRAFVWEQRVAEARIDIEMTRCSASRPPT